MKAHPHRELPSLPHYPDYAYTPPVANFVRTLIEWSTGNARELPWRQGGFSAWGVLVSEFMLQQTPVNRVIPHLEAWLERWPTPSALADEPEARLLG